MAKVTAKPRRTHKLRAARGRTDDRRPEEQAGDGEAPRPPQQDRGQRRVDEILDAAERVALEVGWDAATTQAIAERAGASMGSLFHFFPTKDAILSALARRYARLTFEANERAMPMDAVWLPPVELFDRIIRAQAEASKAMPAFDAVHTAATRRFGPDAGPLCELNDAIYDRVRAFCAIRTPRLSKGRREANVRLMVGVVREAMHAAAALPPSQREDLYVVARDMLASHLTAMDRLYGPAAATGARRPA